MKKKWTVGYYLYDLTEWAEASFYLHIVAMIYAMCVSGYGFKVYIKEVQ